MRHATNSVILISLSWGFSATAWAGDASLAVPFAGDLRPGKGAAEVTVEGPHRFLRVAGKTGYHALSLETKLRIATKAHRSDAGSMVVWVAPLESLSAVPRLESIATRDPLARNYNLVSDTWPARNFGAAVFAWQWQANWNPTVFARFLKGPIRWDHTAVPWVFTEHLPLEEKRWYQLAVTWNKSRHRFRMYANGILTGNNDQPAISGDDSNPELFVGNPAMVFRDLQIWETELTAAEIERAYRTSGMPVDAEVQKHLAALMVPSDKSAFSWSPGSGWKLSYEASFTKPSDLDGWIQQGCLKEPFRMRELRTTPDGLLLDTPAQIENETRVYLWSPRNFEGDIAVEFEFRPERDTGLALLVIQASGMQREDFIKDHPPRTTGSMTTIIGDRVRNYHWEFFRRYDFNLRNGETHVLAKNPWQVAMGMSSTPALEMGRFHRLQFIQEGRRLRGSVDGRLVLDVEDHPHRNMGPIYSFGRIGLRLMYDTRMTFRNLKVWNRNEGVEILP
jgi:hypothetical protein